MRPKELLERLRGVLEDATFKLKKEFVDIAVLKVLNTEKSHRVSSNRFNQSLILVALTKLIG